MKLISTDTPFWKISIDTGGTFTDCLATDPQGRITRIKVLSSSRLRGNIIRKIGPDLYEFDAPWRYDTGLLTGYTCKIGNSAVEGVVVAMDYSSMVMRLDADLVSEEGSYFELYAGEEAPILAARLLTKTGLHETLPPIEMRLGTTRGTNALLERKGARTLLIVTKGFRDLLYIGTQQRPSLFQLDIPEPRLLYSDVIEIDERLDADGEILKNMLSGDFDYSVIRDFESVAVSFLHSYQNDTHEREITTALESQGCRYVSLSSELYPFAHYLRRTQTAVVNAYLDPVLDVYLNNISEKLGSGNLRIMTSTGSLSTLSGFRAKDSLLSGPAGGIVAAGNTAAGMGLARVITFDMGGTSTDVARIDGQPELKYITEIDGIEFHNPTLAIETVAAGGGSVCWFDGFTLQVGPESAGALPGPACYGAGGPLTITDVNLLLGKMDAAKFGIPIRPEAAYAALAVLRDDIFNTTGRQLSLGEMLLGFERIANEKMADAIRKISVQRGVDPAEYALMTFGGAGGLHSCQLADLLDIKEVIIPYDAGLFSAVGIGEALISTIVSRQVLLTWNEAEPQIRTWIEELSATAEKQLALQEVLSSEIIFCSLFLRLAGQENAIEVPYTPTDSLEEFKKRYVSQFGYYPESTAVELESIKLKMQEQSRRVKRQELRRTGNAVHAIRKVHKFREVENDILTPSADLYEWDNLHAGDEIAGPAILLNTTSTAYVPQDWKLVIQSNNDAVAFKNVTKKAIQETYSEEVALQLFTNRFKAIADEMGVQLQRTAFSVNVKERLDFSCALLDQDGELLVNAQHIPVHLGSMGICGRLVRDAIEIGPGDVVITNHPRYGGSHLPDITLLAGVFTKENTCIGYVINRAHHAEVGGKTPGSMPPDATCLAEEGVVILPQYLVKGGVLQSEAMHRLFTTAQYPTRNYMSNEADIIAALSALRKGSVQLLKLVDMHGVETVTKYMNLLKASAEVQLEATLVPLHGKIFNATEYLDDDHHIQLKISIFKGKQIFDFTGTSVVHPNNLNGNISILYSVILYVLRLLINKEIPLNDGLMRNVEIILPDNSFLHPDFSDDPLHCPAVVGGNTEVSQRLVDTLLKAFGLASCSQGTMNNFLFGNENFGYYETIGGGTGAGPGFEGRAAVHQHMTNTRITDPEHLERKYPVRLLEFGIRKNSGGAGRYRGGDGIVRSLQFLKPLQVTLLAQHRKYAPYALEGGKEGACGRHTLHSPEGSQQLPGICSLYINEGDILTIETPGGGGYGKE